MKKLYHLLILLFIFINNIISESSSFKEGIIYPIDEDIEGTTEYKTKTMTYGLGDNVNYFTYDFSSDFPSSNITAFKLDISPFSSEMSGYKVLCTNLLSSSSDSELKAQLEEVKNNETKSSCIHLNQNYGEHDSIMKLDNTKTKIGIAIYIPRSI